jgi:hypothetical protein
MIFTRTALIAARPLSLRAEISFAELSEWWALSARTAVSQAPPSGISFLIAGAVDAICLHPPNSVLLHGGPGVALLHGVSGRGGAFLSVGGAFLSVGGAFLSVGGAFLSVGGGRGALLSRRTAHTRCGAVPLRCCRQGVELSPALAAEMREIWDEADADGSGMLSESEFAVVLEVTALSQWREAYDPASGKRYYYHKVSKETRWSAVESEAEVVAFLAQHGLQGPEGEAADGTESFANPLKPTMI